MPKPATLIVHLKRVRDGGHRKHVTLWFEFEGGAGKSSRARYSIIRPQHMPPFDGDDGWFLVEKAPKGPGEPWGYWRALRQVDPPSGAEQIGPGGIGA